MKIVIVGFKVKEENSVYYKKIEIQSKYDYVKSTMFGKLLNEAYKSGAEFVSVRFIE